MKISIKMPTGDDKKALTGFQLEALEAAKKEECFTDGNTIDDALLGMAAHVYSGDNAAVVLKASAVFGFKHSEPDVWVEALIQARDAYIEAGFYITDLFEATADNVEELQGRAYIRRFELV